jgi:chondroitin AC lyase
VAGSSPAIPTLTARKSWACHDGLVVCLIAERQDAGGPGERFTVLDQCRWQGDVTVDRAANVLRAGDHRMDSVRWIHHAGLAYIFLQPAAIALHMGAATGSWQSINASEPAAPVTEKVFMPVLIHPSGPVSSGYVLAACERHGQARALAERPSWKVLRNSADCQAVRFRDGLTLCAFYTKGSLALDSHRTIAVDNPCLVLVAGERLSISDPSQRQGDLTVRLNNKSRHLQLPKDGTTTSLSF